MTMRSLSLSIALVIMAVSDIAVAEPCQINTEAVKQAVTEVAKTLDEHGIEYLRDNLLKNDSATICGIDSVSIIDHSGTWAVSSAASEYVGKNIRSLGDGAATNFFKGIIQGAIERKGKLVSYSTKDTENGVVINKSLYFIDVPSRKLVVYGAFAAK
ncbi:MAG: hypothetical protein HQL37_08290 [Alphaproteobacteria bacterium]|nr:hypothetical protein [Alphaproteobacteria bacterium]